MGNLFEDVQQYVADKLNADSQLSGLCSFIPEERKDIDFEIKNALGRQGIVGLIMVPRATFAGNFEDKSLVWQIDELEIDVVENVTVNRGKKDGYITGQAASMRLFDVLCPLSGDNVGQFLPVSYEEGEDGNLLVNKCVLKCLVHVTGNQPTPPHTTTTVKYTETSGLPDWEGDIVGKISGGSYTATTQIPNVTSAEEVEIGTHVTSIGNSAFYGCKGLKSVTIPDSVNSIGFVAFTGCEGLTRVTIPNSVRSIGNNVFSSCIGLTDVVIGNGVTSIGDSAFSSCIGLTSVTIPNGVTSIQNGLFAGCVGLTSVTIPDGVTSIGRYSFSGCTSLKNINSNDGVYLSDEIKTIGQYAFQDSVIENLSFNNLAAMGIDSNAFVGCNQLTDVVVRGVTTHEAMSLENYPWGISNENIIRGDRGA